MAETTEPLRVISSEPLDRSLVEEMAADLGEITLLQPKPAAPVAGAGDKNSQGTDSSREVSGGGSQWESILTAGATPTASSSLDHEVIFPTPLFVVDWASAKGERQRTAAMGVAYAAIRALRETVCRTR